MIKSYFTNYYTMYGILGIAAATAVFLKMMLFYFFVGTATNLVPVLIVSWVLTYLLFACFENKWIPAVVFAAFSVLMVCDVTYASFFNRYLSVNMAASAVFLGDIVVNILVVFRASYLLLLVDAVLVFICLTRKRKRDRRESAEAQAGTKLFEEGARFVFPSRLKRNKNKNPAAEFAAKHKKKIAAVLIIAALVANVTGSDFIKSVSNLEIISYHVKDIAYKAFGVTEGDGSMSAFKDTYAIEKEGPLFGVAEGRNLIVIQLESLQNFVIGLEYNGQEVTPNLNRLIEGNTAYFDHYYQQIGSGNTSDAEFASNNSIYGALMSYTYKLYGKQNYFRGLPAMLKEKGYETAVFHAYENKNYWSRQTVYPNMGFDKFYGGLNDRDGDGVYEMNEWMGWGLTDTHFYEQTLGLLDELAEPFYSFIISLSNHHPYVMLDHYRFVEILPEDEGTMLGNYLNSAAYTDFALGEFLDGLKNKGLYDNSIIAVYGDHVGLTHSDAVDASMERLLGQPYDYDTLMSIPLVISVPGAAKDIRQTINVAGGQLDFFPTIAYLMGFDKLDTLYLGHNLFAVKEGLVAEQTYMTKGSFFTNDIAFEMGRDGVFEHGRAWNLHTGEAVPLSECYDDYAKAMEIISTSEYIMRSDAIRRIFIDGEDAEAAFGKNVSRMFPDTIAIAGAPGGDYGSSIKDIEHSYKEDCRCIRIEMGWTEKVGDDDPDPIATNSAGEVVMTHLELIDWMEHHADTVIVVKIQRSGDFFIKTMSKISPAAAERLILELPELNEYTSKHDAIINISNVNQDASEIRDFIEKNKVWAIMMTKEDAGGKFESLMGLDTGIYITGETDGFIAKAN
ncbi:MAG: sulfatase-like hydrolase/transferase [Clostridiales bacterium]|nr:sulfatase-like hydrolase/transferase [Clostridiales bacterium]